MAKSAGLKLRPSPSDIVTVSVKRGDRSYPVEIQRGELIRRAMATNVAKQVMHLVANHHRNEIGRPVILDPQWMQIYADPSTDMRIISAAQRGKTLYQLVKTFAQLTLGMSVGWVMPKEGKVHELVHGKLDPTIKQTPLYASLQEFSNGRDSVKFKTFGPYAKLHIVTANSADELTSFSADAMHVDERDFCNRQNLPMYTSRMNFSPYKLTDEISTPTVEGTKRGALTQRGTDNIHSEFLAGDQYRYFTPCNKCGHLQILDWFDNFVEVRYDDGGRIMDFQIRDQDWSPGAARDIRAMCAQCHYPMNRNEHGLWKPQNPTAAMRTYWVEALASTVGKTMASLLDTFQQALGNPSKMQQFFNMDLGRPFAGGMMRFGAELFEKCVRAGMRMADPMGAAVKGPCTIGIDVNRPYLDIHVSKWFNGRQMKVWCGKINGGEEHVVRLIKHFGITGGVIDHQPETKFSIRIQEAALAHGCRIVRCKYANNEQVKPVVISEAGENPVLDPPRLITVNRTVAIDTLYESMAMGRVDWFEEWNQVIDGALADEFSNPVRKLVINEQGTEKFVWDGIPDHQLHAAVYDLLAGTVLEMDCVKNFDDIGPYINVIQHSHGDVFPTEQRWDNNPMILLG